MLQSSSTSAASPFSFSAAISVLRHLEYSLKGLEDGGEIGGSGVHFPSTPVKYLADLRSGGNSQEYSIIYEDQRPKIVEDIENSGGAIGKMAGR